MHENPVRFSLTYLESIFDKAKKSGYQFLNLREFYSLKNKPSKYFLMRHDVDDAPNAFFKKLIDMEVSCGVRSTSFVQINCNKYNPFDYRCFPAFKYAENCGQEIGLHSNFVEFAEINKLIPKDVLGSHLTALRSFFNVVGLAPHRDLNYMYNSLPFIEYDWQVISSRFGLKYHAYEEPFFENAVYINEGYSPHVCWRNESPENVIDSGRNVYIMIHPHLWHENHIHEY